MTNYYSDVAIVANGSTFQNVIDYQWHEVTDSGALSVVPILVMNSINPVGFRQAHKWVEGDFTVKGTINLPTIDGDGTATAVTLSAYCTDKISNQSFSESFTTAYVTNGLTHYTLEGDATYQYKFTAASCNRV